MYVLSRFWQSTIGKKIVMAVTGVIGILFVIGHMTGNLLMFKGQEAMAQYALLLRTSMPLLWAVRVGLIAAVALGSVVLERTLYARLYSAGELEQVLFTIGLIFISVAVARMIWT